MSIVTEIKEALRALAIAEKAEFFPKFFKSGKGEYGEGDLFLGVKVPDQRAIAKALFQKISLDEVKALLVSPYHEERLTALFILVYKFEKSKQFDDRKIIVDFYLEHLQFVNNWDLVDSTAYKILGRYCYDLHDESILYRLSQSSEMWLKRIAVVGSFYFIKKNSFELTKKLVLENMMYPHDLLHKANGWMLREIGKANLQELLDFLNMHYHNMPRTSLRYAIEKLDEDLRQDYLKGRI